MPVRSQPGIDVTLPQKPEGRLPFYDPFSIGRAHPPHILTRTIQDRKDLSRISTEHSRTPGRVELDHRPAAIINHANVHHKCRRQHGRGLAKKAFAKRQHTRRRLRRQGSGPEWLPDRPTEADVGRPRHDLAFPNKAAIFGRPFNWFRNKYWSCALYIPGRANVAAAGINAGVERLVQGVGRLDESRRLQSPQVAEATELYRSATKLQWESGE